MFVKRTPTLRVSNDVMKFFTDFTKVPSDVQLKLHCQVCLAWRDADLSLFDAYALLVMHCNPMVPLCFYCTALMLPSRR